MPRASPFHWKKKSSERLDLWRRHLLNFLARLLPLAALILPLFLAALAFSGLEPIWKTGHATPLVLGLQWAILLLTNAAWQDGEHILPFSTPIGWIIRVALALLPLLSVLSGWSLFLRIEQYGWSVDRVWATAQVGLSALCALGYAASACMRGCLSTLGRVNTGLALMFMATLLALHTPVLDPMRIAASSQVGRLLSGAVAVEQFDFDYLRFDLGRTGNAAIKQLADLVDHPQAGNIRARASAVLAKGGRYESTKIVLSKEDIVARLRSYPAGVQILPDFIDYLHAQH